MKQFAKMHKLLRRQLERFGYSPEGVSRSFMQFIEAVNAAYAQADLDRSLLEHSLELTSQELVEQNRRLRQELAERKKAETALRESEERYHLAVRGANVGIWDWDVAAERIFFSARWKSLLSYSDEDIGDTVDEWFDRVHPDDSPRLRAAIESHLRNETPHLHHEYRMYDKRGAVRWILTRGVALRDETGQPYRMAGSQTDISERKKAEEQRAHDAIHDALTGLPNRTLLIDRLMHLVAQSRREQDTRFAVLFLDLDRFKLVNDSLGHPAGDQLLVQTARRLETSVKSGDTLARLGGDEFVILMEDVAHAEDAIHVAERLLDQLRHPFSIDGHEVYTSASLGIVISTDHHKPAEDLLRDADTAMNRAKNMGKACYQIFDGEMHQRAMSRLRLENDLRRALENGQFEIHYQPIFYLPNGRLTGFESLIRWRHPERGLLAPAEFIDVAEEIGLVVLMDYWVMEQACRQLLAWQQRYPTSSPLTVNVNISARHFEKHGLPEKVREVLERSRLAPECLQLEITESSLVRDDETLVTAQLEALRRLGVFLYLDDFGTGYASLSYLHRLPFNGLKIDRSFIQGMGEQPKKSAFVSTILSLAEHLYLFPVIEGIEAEDQLQQIRSLAACCGQGYYLSRPLDLAAAEELIREHWVLQQGPSAMGGNGDSA